MRILVVDDEEMQRTLLKGFLEKQGFKVVDAVNGHEALLRFSELPFQLVLLDHRMPDLPGDQLLKKMKESNPLLRGIMITAFGSVDTAVKVMKLGADDFLEKPVDLTLLQEKIRMIENAVMVDEEAATVERFMDQGERPLILQPKLLRALQEKRISRVGSDGEIPVDTRVLTATNRDLRAMVEEGLFREDLYYRLNVLDIVLPPLRRRREDIPVLTDFFMERYGTRHRRFDADAMATLIKYTFPGNVRELEHMIQRTVTLCRSAVITPQDLPEEIRFYQAADSGTLAERLKTVEIQMLAAALMAVRLCTHHVAHGAELYPAPEPGAKKIVKGMTMGKRLTAMGLLILGIIGIVEISWSHQNSLQHLELKRIRQAGLSLIGLVSVSATAKGAADDTNALLRSLSMLHSTQHLGYCIINNLETGSSLIFATPAIPVCVRSIPQQALSPPWPARGE
jgi:DNA-binding NtrC family response regulator